MEELSAQLAGRQIEWRIGSLPTVDCDPGLMKQVFLNLLSNAAKYTQPREHPVIEIGQTENDQSRVIFVRDNGVGFKMVQADKLFTPFCRLHAQKEFEGTGVGLATVQRIVEKHGGKIWAEAEEGKGATFYFSVARKDNEPASLGRASTSVPTGG